MFNPKSQNCCFEIVNDRDDLDFLRFDIHICDLKIVLQNIQNGPFLVNPVAVVYVISTLFPLFSSFLLNEKYEFQETVLVLN